VPGQGWPSVRAIRWAFPLVVTLAGCASYSTSSSPFIVKKEKGSVSVGNPAALPKMDPAEIQRASREAIARRAASSPQQAPTIERLDPALRDAMAALQKEPSARAHVLVGQQYWRLRVYDAAYDHFSDAISLEPKNVGAWEGRARVWRAWHLPGLALSDVQRARFYGPNRPEVLNTLGTILEQLGQCGGAREAYASALKLDPEAIWARDNLVRLEGRTDTCGG
jgi:cytochrome c-type biogenesis protein CcmH/NrfG